MKNIIREWFNHRKVKKELRLQAGLLQVFTTFEQAEANRLILINTPARQILLSDILTTPFILNDKLWPRFIHNLALWFHYRMMQEYWDRRIRDVTAEAVRDARSKNKHLSGDALKIIRQEAVAKIDYTIPPDLSKLDGFTFAICSGVLRNGIESEAIGVYRNGEIILKEI
ncbi:MAG: hypothetical protein IJ557_02675 [Bacteroidaceae bacterium]|nr:hypothetical protein [Bacteroidaceae bacterium]